MPKPNRQCKAYSEKPNIPPDIFLNVIPVNCSNCRRWNGERCGDEAVALSMNDPGLVEALKLCDW